MEHLIEAQTATAQIAWTKPNAEAILSEATRRFRTRMLSSRGQAGEDDAAALADETIAIAPKLFSPLFGQIDLPVQQISETEIFIKDLRFAAGSWSTRLHEGDVLRMYCLSAGARGADVWQHSNEDYVLASTLHLLGSEIVYAIGRGFDKAIRSEKPDRNYWQKLALLSREESTADYCKWDPAVGHSFFTKFVGNDQPVSITSEGSFDPIHTVLGLYCHCAK